MYQVDTLPTIGALVLAGGKSSRMGGRQKASLVYQNATFLERLASAFTGFPELLLSSNQPELGTGSGFQVIPDQVLGRGPLEGLACALAVCKSDALVIAPCDMPFITADFTVFLRDTFCRNWQYPALSITDYSGRLNPLCGVYKKSAAAAIQAALDHGECRVSKVFYELGGLAVPIVSIGFPEKIFTNINYPEDLQKLRPT